MTGALLPGPRFTAFYPNGAPLSAGYVYTLDGATSAFKRTWQDAAHLTPNTNPVVLDANGAAILYGTGTYVLTITDNFGNSVTGIPVSSASDIELEDGTGHWLWESGDAIEWGSDVVDIPTMGLESGTGSWLFEDVSTVEWG